MSDQLPGLDAVIDNVEGQLRRALPSLQQIIGTGPIWRLQGDRLEVSDDGARTWREATDAEETRVTVAPSTISFACGRDRCRIRIELVHSGYTIRYPRSGDDALDASFASLARDIAWASIVEEWRHEGECRTFTQQELLSGEPARWLDSLHGMGQ